MPASDEQAARATEADWIAFSGLERMKSHWDRQGWWPGRRGYYWYLTFAEELRLHEIAAHCQAELNAPYFDLVPSADLHMTLERVAFDSEVDATTLAHVTSAAAEACQTIPPFSIYVGPLAGSSGAISFSASPHAAIAELRDVLKASTKAVLGTSGPADSTRFRPHVGIAYCNRNVAAEPVIRKVRSLRSLPVIEVNVQSASLVALTRKQSSYHWAEWRNIPLCTG